jgi:hypothetical protein
VGLTALLVGIGVALYAAGRAGVERRRSLGAAVDPGA